MADIPTSPNFDYNGIRVMDPYPALILVGEPNRAIPFEIGSLTPVPPNQVSYMLRLNGRELGTPGFGITITTLPIIAAAPAITLALRCGPGVRTKTWHKEDSYSLTSL